MLTLAASAQQPANSHKQQFPTMPQPSAVMPQQFRHDMMRPMDKPATGMTLTTDIDAYAADAPGTAKQKKRSISIGRATWRHIRTVQKDAEGNTTRTQDNVVDEKGNYLEKTARSYVSGKLAGGRKYTYAYDEYGNLTKGEAYTLNPKDPENGAWLLDGKDTWEYDASQNMVKHIFQQFDMYTQQLINGSQTDYTYNERGLCTSQTDWNYNNGSWRKLMCQMAEYDEFGSICMNATLSGWDNSINGWTSGEKKVALYKSMKNGDGTYLAVSGGYEWDSAAQDWKIINEETLEYDDYGRIAEQKALHQDNSGSFWGYWYKYEYFANEKTKSYSYSWDDTNKKWTLNEYSISLFDENGCQSHTDVYNGKDELKYGNDYTWQKIMLDPIVYPDIFFVGSETSWSFLAGKEATDLGGGKVEWKNVTIKKTDEFKFASSDWTTFNWGLNYGDQPIPTDQDVRLTSGPSSQNITLDIQTDEVNCESILLDVINGIVHIKTVPTGVSEIGADKARIEVEDGSIAVTGAKQVAVYNAGGSLVGNTARTAVEPGIYMVKADGKTVKVAVK